MPQASLEGNSGKNLGDRHFPGQSPQDALNYLDQVKLRFTHQPEMYNKFLDMMKDYKSQTVDTSRVMLRVCDHFWDHLDLIHGFNTFLPPGYKIMQGSYDDSMNVDEDATVESPVQQSQTEVNGGDLFRGQDHLVDGSKAVHPPPYALQYALITGGTSEQQQQITITPAVPNVWIPVYSTPVCADCGCPVWPQTVHQPSCVERIA